MKRREEEKLIDLAYEELPENEALQLEYTLRADSRSLARLNDYRSLKQDMALLNRIPEPQISKERIREAILRRGLKERNTRLTWAYAVAPCLVALIAFGIVYGGAKSAPVKPQNSTGSRVAMQSPTSQIVSSAVQGSSPVATFTAPAEPEMLRSETELTDPGRAVRSDYTFGTPSAAPLHSVRFHASYRRESGRAASIADKDMDAMVMADGLAPDSSPAGNANQVPAAVNPAPVSASPIPQASDGKIIVVHDAQDRATGAQQATEADTTANDLFSG